MFGKYMETFQNLTVGLHVTYPCDRIANVTNTYETNLAISVNKNNSSELSNAYSQHESGLNSSKSAKYFSLLQHLELCRALFSDTRTRVKRSQ